jgi:hypothetical protein
MPNMSKFDRRLLFERLCQLRALYRLRGDWDATSAISIDDAVAYAVHLLDEPNDLDVALGIEQAGDATAPGSDSKR